LAKLWLEGGGGGQNYETYELAAYFYARRVKMPNADKRKSFFFFTGDEGYYPAVLKDFVKDYIGETVEDSIASEKIFTELQSKFNVFFFFTSLILMKTLTGRWWPSGSTHWGLHM